MPQPPPPPAPPPPPPPQNRCISAVVLDLDGTLIDHTGSVVAALRAWLPSLGVTATQELITAWFDAQERHLPAWRAREISFAEQRRRRLRDFLPLIDPAPGDDAELDHVFAGYLAHYEAAWTAFDDVEPALAVLAAAEVPTAVLTNGTVEQQNAKLAAVGLAGRVGPVLTAEELGADKPSPSAYLAACAALGVPPGDVLRVGDRHDLDVVAPRAAGLLAVHLDRDAAGPHDEPDRITSLTQLRDYLPDPRS